MIDTVLDAVVKTGRLLELPTGAAFTTGTTALPPPCSLRIEGAVGIKAACRALVASGMTTLVAEPTLINLDCAAFVTAPTLWALSDGLGSLGAAAATIFLIGPFAAIIVCRPLGIAVKPVAFPGRTVLEAEAALLLDDET